MEICFDCPPYVSAGCAGHPVSPVSPPPLVLLKFKHILNRKFCAANGAPVTTRRGGYLTRDYSDYYAYAFTGLMMIIVLNISPPLLTLFLHEQLFGLVKLNPSSNHHSFSISRHHQQDIVRYICVIPLSPHHQCYQPYRDPIWTFNWPHLMIDKTKPVMVWSDPIYCISRGFCQT